MKRFMDQYESVIAKYPNREAFVDKRERIDYKTFDDRASRIYAYLKNRGISKEDRVMIYMPRGIDTFAAVMGVMKCGAAFITLEDDYPTSRVAYIREDVSPKLVLDEEIIRRIYREQEPLAGHEETDVHDALLAIYTSGSTGNPKGILHEYGLADAIMAPGFFNEKATGGVIVPVYFIAMYIFFYSFMAKAITIHIIDEGIVRDFTRLRKYIYDEKLNIVYLPPSYIRLYTQPSPYLDIIATGSEPANGIFYPDGKPTIFNIYSMSECGFLVLQMNLDRKYDVAPVGRPSLPEMKYVLLDEEGNVIEGEGQGELCFENPFSRGYIHLPEKTREVFVDGLYHTRDIARRDKNGIYYIVGRIDDMIKIAGNRIEPAEIEAKVQEITGLKKVVAKGFDTGERAFICVYYIREEAEKLGILKGDALVVDRERLRTLLPEYMIPAYYVPLDAFPLTDSKKIAKKLLKMPEVSDYLTDFEPPENDREGYLCELFAQVLGLPRVGRNDDFFLLGGDSMKAIQCVSESVRYAFSFDALRENSTPAKLGTVCRERLLDERRENRMEKRDRVENISGLPFADALQANVSANTTYVLKDDVNRKLLQEAWDRVLLRYAFFRQRLTLDGGKVYYIWGDVDTRVPEIGEDIGMIDRPTVFASGNRIRVSTPHAYTDGFGMKVFEQTLIAEYLALKAGSAKAIVDNGYIEEQFYEILSEDYSDYGKTIPALYRNLEPLFHIQPEGEEYSRYYCYDYEADMSRMDRLIARLFPGFGDNDGDDLAAIGGALPVAVANIVARAIYGIHPENRLPIACRCPVNARKVLGHGEGLKNMSMCQATFKIPVGEMEEGCSRSMAEARTAVAPDVLKWQLSMLKDVLSGKDPGKRNREAQLWLYNSTFLISCQVSRSQIDLPDEIEDIKSENFNNMPLAIYIFNFRKSVRIRFIQRFEDDRYFSEFCRLCESWSASDMT